MPSSSSIFSAIVLLDLQFLLMMFLRCFNFFSEDAEKLRLHTVSEAGDMDSLEKMVDGSDSEE